MAGTFVPVPNTAEVKVIGSYLGQEIMNTFYFHKSSAWDTTSLQALADAAWERWTDIMLDDLTSGYQLTQTTAIDLTTQTSGEANHTGSENGRVSAGANMAPFAAFVIKFLTASRGRSYRGRVYIGGLNDSQLLDAGTLTSTAADAILSDVEEFCGGVAIDTGTEHVVVSRYSGVDANHKPIPRTTGISTPVTAYAKSDNYLDVQRRRAIGRGI